MKINDKVRLLKPDLLPDDEENEIATPEGTLGTVCAVDKRLSITIYEIQFDNGTMVLYSEEEDGKDYLEVVE